MSKTKKKKTQKEQHIKDGRAVAQTIKEYPDIQREAPLDEKTGKPREKRHVTLVRAEKWWAERARTNPIFFHEYILEKPAAEHHKIWYSHIFSPKFPRLNLIGPRESAKTTVLAVAMAWLIGKAPLLTNGIISVSSVQAEARLRMIRRMIGDNERYHNVFPYIAIDKKQGVPDTQTEFSVRHLGMDYRSWRSMVSRYSSDKDPTLFVAGAGGKGVIGKRISGLLLLDDIIDETMLTPLAQEKMLQYIMQTCEPTIQRTGQMVNIGTRWMIGDVPQSLMENPAWHSITIPAIKFDAEGNRRSYWPSFWSLADLDKKKETMQNDVLFNIMYMNDPRATTANLFSIEDLSQDIPRPFTQPFKGVYIATDSAVSLRNYADFNCYMAVGVDNDDNYYILDMFRFKSDPDVIMSNLVSFAEKVAFLYGRLDMIIFERAGFQAFFKGIFASQHADLPVDDIAPRGDKGHRAELVSNIAKRRKLFINQRLPELNVLQSEWLNFPIYPHDDTLDPIGLLLQYLASSISVVSVETIRSEFLL